MRQPSRFTPLLLLLLSIAPTLSCLAADAPATQPDPAADRLTFLTLQLSSTEASLTALATALRNAGYKSVVSSNTAQFYAHNNQELDINGGGPVPWDKFYAKTAKGFAPRDILGFHHNYDRPDQFNYIYRANNDQIEKANNEVAALGKKIDVLIARRRQLEAEQSAIWATISWESIQNDDISLNPLYRFQLKALNAIPASDARRDLLRPAILFLRTIDKTVADDLDSVHTNQPATLTDLSDRTQAAYIAAKEPLATAMLSADLSPDDLKTAKDLLAAMKRFSDLSKNITEAYNLALDGDTANDDTRKLTFRAALQTALLDYSTAASDLDDRLTTLAKTWGLEPEKGVANPDPLPASTTKITPSPANTTFPLPISPPVAEQKLATPEVANDWKNLFNDNNFDGWEKQEIPNATWKIENGIIDGKCSAKIDSNPKLDVFIIQTTKQTYKNFQLHLEATPGEPRHFWVNLRSDTNLEGYSVHIAGTDNAKEDRTTGSITRNKTNKILAMAPKTKLQPDQWFALDITVIGNKITVSLDGKQITTFSDPDPPTLTGAIGFASHGLSEMRFKNVMIKELPDSP